MSIIEIFDNDIDSDWLLDRFEQVKQKMYSNLSQYHCQKSQLSTTLNFQEIIKYISNNTQTIGIIINTHFNKLKSREETWLQKDLKAFQIQPPCQSGTISIGKSIINYDLVKIFEQTPLIFRESVIFFDDPEYLQQHINQTTK